MPRKFVMCGYVRAHWESGKKVGIIQMVQKRQVAGVSVNDKDG